MSFFGKISSILPGLLFILALSAVLLISDLANRRKKTSDNKQFKIAIVHWIDAPFTENVEKGIYKGLEENGLINEKNIKLSVYKASGDISMLNSIFNQVKTQSFDLIFVSCTPALQAAIRAIKEIPVVFTCVADPVLIGAGTDNVHHLANITGCKVSSDFRTMCRLISENAPQIKILGSIFCPGEIISVKFRDEFIRISSQFGLTVKFFPANNSTELPDAVLGMTSSGIDAVCQMGDNLMSSGISTLIKGVVNANLPYFEFNESPPGIPMECLIHLKVDYFQNGYDAAILATEILLHKQSPAELPFREMSKPVIEINEEKSLKFGIKFSIKE